MIHWSRPARSCWAAILAALAVSSGAGRAAGSEAGEAARVRVSSRDPRYLELSDGSPYIPIGLNMIAPHREGGLDGMEVWIEKLARNSGNFIRVWLGHPFFDVEHTRSGVYDPQRARRICRMLEICRRHGVRVKMCIESFRHFGTRRQSWSEKSLHLVSNGGPARDIADFFDGKRSRAQFRRKLAWLQGQFGNDPTVFGWELWNEINAVAGGDYMAWTEVMLAKLQELFPQNLCMQSLGSFDRAGKRRLQDRLGAMPGNDVAQVHRYLDLGAELEVCRGPVDVLAADAVRQQLASRPGCPVLLAESGAVEPSHTGPFKLYAKDSAGIILHDVLFAPFFSGAAGPGHCWHWDRYVDANNLWWQFGRFAAAVRDVDPAGEGFQPRLEEHPRLRLYTLAGKRTTLVWCRDRRNTWRSELEEHRPAEPVIGVSLGGLVRGEDATVRAYDPWSDRWEDVTVKDGVVDLPVFTRSLVLQVLCSP